VCVIRYEFGDDEEGDEELPEISVTRPVVETSVAKRPAVEASVAKRPAAEASVAKRPGVYSGEKDSYE
jgi:hypothetical protein